MDSQMNASIERVTVTQMQLKSTARHLWTAMAAKLEEAPTVGDGRVSEATFLTSFSN